MRKLKDSRVQTIGDTIALQPMEVQLRPKERIDGLLDTIALQPMEVQLQPKERIDGLLDTIALQPMAGRAQFAPHLYNAQSSAEPAQAMSNFFQGLPEERVVINYERLDSHRRQLSLEVEKMESGRDGIFCQVNTVFSFVRWAL